MLRLLADENIKGALLRGLRRKGMEVDLVRVHDVGLGGADDPSILEWAAANDRIVLTHDLATMPAYAYDRLIARQRMPGVIVIPLRLSVGRQSKISYCWPHAVGRRSGTGW